MSGEQGESPENFPNDLKSFEAKFGSLRPVASRIDRDRLMYEAGAAASIPAASIPAARASRLDQWLWPCASAALLLVATILGIALAIQGRSPERIVHVSQPTATSQKPDAPAPDRTAIDESGGGGSRLSEDSNLALRDRALRFGVDAIGLPRRSSPGPTTPEIGNRSLLQQMLGT